MIAALTASMLVGLQDPQVFRTDVTRVRVDVHVVDRGRPVQGLRAQDFDVRDNGAVMDKVELTTTSERLAVAVALDVGHTEGRAGQQELIDACDELLAALLPGDRVWFLTFSGSFKLDIGPTSDTRRVRRALGEITLGPQYSIWDTRRGPGSVWDTMFGAMSLVARDPGRSLVVMMTDGVDRTSWLDEPRMLEVLRRGDVVVNGVRPRGVVDGLTALEQAANTTGGLVFHAERTAKLRQQFVELFMGFRLGYVLSWEPPPTAAKNGWHEVRIDLKNRRGTVLARNGYYEPGR
jgi:Ca-activated chloride channel family protein